MRKNSKDIKKNFPREKEVIRSSKKIERPWVMQYKWFSREAFNKNYPWMKKYDPEWQTGYDKYTDTEHALQMLNKEYRSYSWVSQQWNDRESRLYNKTTGEILPLEVQGTEVKIV
jgi:hypothetical protein